MHEHIARALYYFEIHLLYVSMVVYWIWVATSFNFVLPVGAVADTLWASHLSWAAPLGAIGGFANTISRGWIAAMLSVVWLLGATLMVVRRSSRIHAERRDAQAAGDQGAHDSKRGFLVHGVLVRFAGNRQTPAVDGILHPHISLPNGIDRLLSEHELEAVLIHELSQARRHDNLIRMIHEVSFCMLWFHPLVWIAGSRLALYREHSCDESVIQSALGEKLVSALAKLANPEMPLLLQASASSFIRHRLARLAASP